MTEAQKKYNKKQYDNRILKCQKGLELYLTGKYSIAKLGKILHTNSGELSKFIKNKGIEIVNRQNLSRFNIHVFDVIDSDEKAYWLGFLYADGSVSSRDNTIELSLALKDIDHLYKFKEFIEYKGNVKQDSFRCRVVIGSKYLKNRLIELGCPPRKSLILKFPNTDIISDDLLFSFIRGYFDGDGCIYIPKTYKKSKSIISLIGTQEFLEGLLVRTNWKNNKLIRKSNKSTNTFSLAYGGKHILYKMDKMYTNASVYLNRKYNKYQEFALLYSNI